MLKRITSLNLLPFLDIIFATIGIFIIVFAFQEIVEHQQGKLPPVDHFVFCTSDEAVQVFMSPTASPQGFSRRDIRDFFQMLEAASGGVRNIVFAFDANCFNLQLRFVQQFDRYTAKRAEDTQGRPTAFQLSLQPLEDKPEAVEAVLQQRRKDKADE
ncbi:hypothetical protein [Candidatus Entotheonella palauensis]|uniref:hypothetical protein n=1 Tax=Candidatus Entotheonella palauensis TaxID=93172 RepID=UPI000B7DFB66|nr:hypothetical protein [Candidatus Entotheonella palauensis]